MSRAASLAPYPPQPVTLTGASVVLEPLGEQHGSALMAAAADPALRDLWFTTVPAPDTVPAWLAQCLALQSDGRALVFAVRDTRSGEIVGTTRYMNIEPDRRRLEIGSTWYMGKVQRTPLNTEAKLLLLTHAFDTLGCIAVELRTHFFNFRSREAIAKLGARQDGILRQHMVLPDGSLRDTVVFSILDVEWPAVRTHLRARLARLGQTRSSPC